eukprot:gnl/MRDRNA2_/MRDRNA2_141586_c0_seq1.p1 gnl/MRDRNA2_/MRDRNA2_141586_c0~~gnl/MRDRNA2_/MRDRNA2_141586_c0_seq1.p1  ORF type:complete len:645 (+),score=86.47 gnl/MRDRNA2_/MRDRNA2_141586_c0_seq1:121-2055(+)
MIVPQRGVATPVPMPFQAPNIAMQNYMRSSLPPSAVQRSPPMQARSPVSTQRSLAPQASRTDLKSGAQQGIPLSHLRSEKENAATHSHSQQSLRQKGVPYGPGRSGPIRQSTDGRLFDGGLRRSDTNGYSQVQRRTTDGGALNRYGSYQGLPSPSQADAFPPSSPLPQPDTNGYPQVQRQTTGGGALSSYGSYQGFPSPSQANAFPPSSPMPQPSVGYFHRSPSDQQLPRDRSPEIGPLQPMMSQETLQPQPQLAMTQQVLPRHSVPGTERSFLSRARSSSPPAHSPGRLVSTKSLSPNPHTRQYSEKDSRKVFRDEQLPKQNIWEIEGWAFMKMGKYESQYSNNDLFTAEGMVERLYGNESSFSPFYLKINGWTMNFWENIEAMKGHLAGRRECKPVGWIDTRRAHGVSLQKKLNEAPLVFQVSLHFSNGHLRFRVQEEGEAQRWIDALHHIVYDRSIARQVAQDTSEKRRQRFRILSQLLKDMVRTASHQRHVVHHEQAATLFRLYDVNNSNDLEIGQLLLMIKELSAARRSNLIEFMTVYEKSLSSKGQSFIGKDTTGSAKELKERASYLLRLYEQHLNPDRLVREAIDLKEQYDSSHDGSLQFKEFLPLAQMIVFPEEVIQQELTFYKGLVGDRYHQHYY